MAEFTPTRRRILVAAAAGSCGVLAGLMPSGRRGAPATATVDWRGRALGADARIIIAGRTPSGIDADRVLAECWTEIVRLEQVASLYLATSEIVRLNADGALADASPELRTLMSMSRLMHSATNGLFDPTVQPLWQAYAGWYGSRPDGEPLPTARLLDARCRVGLSRVELDGRRLRLPDGGGITLNGIAQGFITDRIADLLRRRGFEHVLLDIGEVRAIGSREDGQPFDVAVKESGRDYAVADAALATSSPPALMMSRAAGIGHILHPASGLTPAYWRSVTVRHASAAVADALSTALSIATPDEARDALRRVGGADAWLDGRFGHLHMVG